MLLPFFPWQLAPTRMKSYTSLPTGHLHGAEGPSHSASSGPSIPSWGAPRPAHTQPPVPLLRRPRPPLEPPGAAPFLSLAPEHPRTPSPRAHYTGPCSVPRLAHSSASGRLRVPILTPSSPPAAAQQRKDANLIAPPPPSARTSAGPSPLALGTKSNSWQNSCKTDRKKWSKGWNG